MSVKYRLLICEYCMKNCLKLVKFLSLIMVSFFFSSCIDFVETIGVDDGNYQIYTKMTFSKTMFAYAGVDADILVKELSEEIINDGISFIPVNATSEIGVQINASILPESEDKLDLALMPRISGNTYVIPFIMGDAAPAMQDKIKDEDENSVQMINMMLSTAKCRIFISKNVIPYAKAAYFDGTEKVLIDLFDFGEQYCLEIPFSLLATPSDCDFRLITVLGE